MPLPGGGMVFVGGGIELVGGGMVLVGGGIELAGGGMELVGGGMAFPGAVLAGGESSGAFAGIACSGTVGVAAGATLCTATRRFCTSESMSCSEKLGLPRGSVTSTLLPAPSFTSK